MSSSEPAGGDWSGVEYSTPQFALAVVGALDPLEKGKALAPRPQLQEVKACVEAAGFTYYIEDEITGNPEYSMDPESFARTWGFGATAQMMGTYPGLTPADIAASQRAAEESRTPAYTAVQADCLQTTGVDLAADARAVQAAYDLQASVLADPQMQDAAKAWSACMGQSGYQYDTPEQMRNSFFGDPGTDPQARLEEEKRVAVANLACEPAYRERFRAVATEHLGEFEDALTEPITAGSSDAVG